MRIIPAIDIIDGKCVRLQQGNYDEKKIYFDDPLEAAQMFETSGLSYLHVVDLDGAKAGKVVNWNVIERITSKTNLKVDVGGGIRTDEEIKKLLACGVSQVNIGSIAVRNKNMVFDWMKAFGTEQIILSADARNEQIYVNGWQHGSAANLFDFVAEYVAKDIRYVACTDIAMDGTLAGPNVSLYEKLLAQFPTVKWIASGGIKSVDDLTELKTRGMNGVIIGKAIYEGRISLEQLKVFSSC